MNRGNKCAEPWSDIQPNKVTQAFNVRNLNAVEIQHYGHPQRSCEAFNSAALCTPPCTSRIYEGLVAQTRTRGVAQGSTRIGGATQGSTRTRGVTQGSTFWNLYTMAIIGDDPYAYPC